MSSSSRAFASSTTRLRASSGANTLDNFYRSLFVGNAKSRLVAWFTFLVVLVLLRMTFDLANSSQFRTPGTVLDNYREEQLFVNDESELQVPTSESTNESANSTAMAAATEPNTPPPTPFDKYEKGIILSLFNDVIPMGVSLIKELRCLGNHELIQVYHCFPDELSRANRALLHQQDDNLEIIDVCSEAMLDQQLNLDQAKEFRSWWLKPLALVHTKLKHVMMLDADAILFKNPAVVRDLPGYQETGTMFFYDRVIDYKQNFDNVHEGKQVLRVILEGFDYNAFNITSGFQPSPHLKSSFAYNRQTSHEMDSSMVFVDKSRAQKAMQVLFHLITETRHKIHFSHGDKEAFWLAFELAHSNYTFSPWGVSVISSTSNNDMKNHPHTLCGNMAHFIPAETPEPELLYVNGKALLEPFPLGVEETMKSTHNILFNTNPTHITPRQPRRGIDRTLFLPGGKRFPDECLVGMGSRKLDQVFHKNLLRRRMHFFGLKTGVTDILDQCLTTTTTVDDGAAMGVVTPSAPSLRK